MTGRRRPTSIVMRALAGETLARPPLWLMRQAGRYLPEYRELRRGARDFLDLCFSPKRAAEATLQPIRRFGLDAAILFSDILVVPWALGRKVEYREGEGPVVETVRERAAVESLPHDGVTMRLAPVYETVQRVTAKLPAGTALIGFAGAPWTVATYMVEGGSSRDFAATKRWSLRDPEGFGVLIGRLVTATIDHLSAQIEAGADAVQLFDSWAGVLDENSFRRWVIEPTKRITAALAERHPDVPIIGFPRGAGLMYRAYVDETGITAIGLDSMVPRDVAQRTLQCSVPVQGNLDPFVLLVGSALQSEVEAILASFGGGPFVFNLGHGVLPDTPIDHVAQLVELVRRGP